MPLVISRANIPADLPAIIPPMISTFYSPPSCVPYAQALWGDPSPRAQRLARQRFDHEVVEDPTGFWLKCVDTDAKPGDFRAERFEPAGDTSNGVNGDANGAAKVAEGAHEGVVVGISHWKLYPQWIDKIAAPWDVNVDYYADDQPEKKQAEETLRTLPEITNRAGSKFAKDGQKGEPHVRTSWPLCIPFLSFKARAEHWCARRSCHPLCTSQVPASRHRAIAHRARAADSGLDGPADVGRSEHGRA